MPTRAKQAEDKGESPYFPPLADEVRYLLEHLQSLGYVEPGMGGPLRLSYAEIAAWCALYGVELRPWEVHVLREMSDAFARELIAAEHWQHPAPWAAASEQIDQKAVAQRVKDVLRS